MGDRDDGLDEGRRFGDDDMEARADSILAACTYVASTPGRRSTRPPELTPLSEKEVEAVRAAIVAASRGIDVKAVLWWEWVAECRLQTAKDRRVGRLADLSTLKFPELLDEMPDALCNSRVSLAFLQWLQDESTSERKAKRGLKYLLQRLNPNVRRKRRDHGFVQEFRTEDGALTRVTQEGFAWAVAEQVAGLRKMGIAEKEAVRRVAAGQPTPLTDDGITWPSLPESTVRYLMKIAAKMCGTYRTLATHRRPNRSKPKMGAKTA